MVSTQLSDWRLLQPLHWLHAREDYEREHIAGAISLPLKELNRGTAERLDRERAVVVYCNDYQ